MTKAIEAAAEAVADYTDQRLPPHGDVRTCEGIAEAAVTAYLAAMKAEGFVMVPVEPTEAMLEAGRKAFYEPPVPNTGTVVYRAMIAASTPHEGS